MIATLKNIIPILSKEMLEKEKKDAEKKGNLSWPILPAIYSIPKKEK